MFLAGNHLLQHATTVNTVCTFWSKIKCVVVVVVVVVVNFGLTYQNLEM